MMRLTLKIWRQENATAKGSLQTYSLDGVSPDMSFLEMMDVLNEQLMEQGIDPVAFDHDCREGVCGSCSMFINGEAVSYTHLRAHESGRNLVCRLLLEKKK